MRARASTRKINRERNVIASHFTAFSWKSCIWSEFLGLNSNMGIRYTYLYWEKFPIIPNQPMPPCSLTLTEAA